MRAVALIEEKGKNRRAVNVKVCAHAATRVNRAVGRPQKAGQVLQIIVDFRIGHLFHPRRRALLPPDTIAALVVSKLNRVMEFVRNRHAQRVESLSLLIYGVGVVVVDFEIARRSFTGALRIGEAVRTTAS